MEPALRLRLVLFRALEQHQRIFYLPKSYIDAMPVFRLAVAATSHQDFLAASISALRLASASITALNEPFL